MARTTLAVLLVCLSSCGDDDGTYELDARPSDTGARDSSQDTGFDSGPGDAGFDSGPGDAGFDSGLDDASIDSDPVDAGFDSGPVDAGFDSGPADAGFDAFDPCAPNPCENGGTCNSPSGIAVCSCPPGFEGALCETAVDPCDPNPCLHGGSCTDIGSSFYCSCFPDWNGPTCEECGYPCSDRPDYYRGRFLTCYRDPDFCDRPEGCLTFCSGWMGCYGELSIESDGVTDVTGPDPRCL